MRQRVGYLIWRAILAGLQVYLTIHDLAARMKRPWWTRSRGDHRRYMNQGTAYWAIREATVVAKARLTGACRCCGLKGGAHKFGCETRHGR